MQTISKFIQFIVGVTDMPKAKEFYADKLGLKIMTDFRQEDSRWWVSLATPGGGATIVLSTYYGEQKPGTMSLYFGTSDIALAHKELSGKGLNVTEIKDDLYGPGSGVAWFTCKDPDGSVIYLAQS
ncbi:MAG: VOC family protein [Patescibacteria group bacterium]|nr:VOC family protein [Patescibacteria group bacterium]